MGKVPDSFLSKKVLFLSDLGQSTLVVEDQLLGKRGGSVWDGRGGVEEGVWGVREEESGGGSACGGREGEWMREYVGGKEESGEGRCGWEVKEGVCGRGEWRRKCEWERRRVEEGECEWERRRGEEGVCGWERKRVEEEVCGREEEKSGGGRCG